MRLSKLKKLSSSEAEDAFFSGRISRFKMKFSNYLRGEIGWPEYKPADVTALRERFGLTQVGLGLLLRVSPKTVLRWESVEGSIPTTAVIALFTLDKLREEIFQMMNEDIPRFRLVPAAGSKSDPERLLGDWMSVPPPETFGKEEVKALRDRLRLTLPELAELIGVSSSTMEKWERGIVTPKGPSLALLKLLWTHGAGLLR